jgi:hypothetical protein
MLPVRKDRAGTSSGGYEWKNDGEIVEVDEQHAAELMRIPNGGFSIVFPDEDQAEAEAEQVEAPAPIPAAALNPPAESHAPAEVPAAAKAQADTIPAAAKAKPASSRAKSAKAEPGASA